MWLNLIPSRTNVCDKYILFYNLNRSNDANILCRKLKDHLGVKVIEIKGKINHLEFRKRVKQSCSPLEYLSLIKNAEYVVSTSFHGTAFSIIFEKQFYTVGLGMNSERVTSLLNYLNIKDRYLNLISSANFKEKIDYKDVNQRLENLKLESITFLDKNIN